MHLDQENHHKKLPHVYLKWHARKISKKKRTTEHSLFLQFPSYFIHKLDVFLDIDIIVDSRNLDGHALNIQQHKNISIDINQKGLKGNYDTTWLKKKRENIETDWGFGDYLVRSTKGQGYLL